MEDPTCARRRLGGPGRDEAPQRSRLGGAAWEVPRPRSSHRSRPTRGPARGRQHTTLTVLDAYAVLAFLKGDSAAGEVERLIRAGGTALTAVGVAEVLDHLIRVAGADEEDATLDLAQLGLETAIPVDETCAAAAGRLRARNYHRTRCPVSLADCVAAETARANLRPLATSDPPLLDLCHNEHIQMIMLPGSDGSTWSPPS